MKAHTITKRFLGILLSILLLAACKDAGNNNLQPQITAIQPESGPPGTGVTITGTGFSPEASQNIVRFGSTPAPVNSASESQITTIVPEDSQSGAVSITVRNVTATGPNFTVEPKAPGISGVEPDSGTVGAQVTITGMNFSATPSENTITFNGTAASVNNASETELITEVPDGASDGPVEVTVNQKTTTGPDFNVITTGTLEVNITTSGKDQDSDGYTLSMDDSNDRTVNTNDKVYISGIEEGSHEVELSEIKVNCTLEGDNTRQVNIIAADTTSVTFEISCKAAAINQVAFFSNRTGNSEIFLMDPDGDDVQQLTDKPGTDQLPAISKDGTKIAFISNRTDNLEIYTMDADGTNLKQITSTANLELSVDWSPDGSKLVFSSFNEVNSEIYTINADGGELMQLTQNSFSDRNPSWSPNGDRIVFESDRNGTFNIYTMNPDGKDVERVTTEKSNDGVPQWSPDGSKLVFGSDRDGNFNIYTMDANGTNLQRITNSPASDYNPTWSPDGTKLIFDTNRDGNQNIYIVNADGSGEPKNITAKYSDHDATPYWSPVE